MKYFLTLLTLVISLFELNAQQRNQFFDGADTIPFLSIKIHIDSNSNNSWQIGSPQKNIFNQASTLPNALLTDTINNYKPNDSSFFKMEINRNFAFFGIIALQWNQKLDFENKVDGGIIEYSTDTGKTWTNVVNNPYTYSFYGYDLKNIDTLANGKLGFTGVDTNWRNIWLCFDLSWMWIQDSIEFRYSIFSDSTNQHEGWMIDNMIYDITFIHTINENETSEYIEISPNPASNRVSIKTRKSEEFHIIEKMQLIDLNGDIVYEWTNCPTNFYFETNNFESGVYFLKIKTNLKTEIHKLIIEK
ncbi:MAG: T9SS type A sorting domain-containing protein [Flavobacteriales bacterium]|nr:T9SS type A sorting domain-containing protein [Flavobacteriales bacterium]